MADDLDDDDWQVEAKNRYKAALSHWSKWREEARQCFDYYAGHQWSDDDLAHLGKQQRPAITFNRIAPLVDAVLGHEANNRTETRYIPRQIGDAKVAEQITAASDYFRDQCDADHEESDAFRDAIVSGVGCTLNRLDDVKNPEWDLIKERVDPLEILVDPASKKPNFDDRRYMFRSKRFPRSEIRQRWPDHEWAEGGDWETAGEGVNDSNPHSAYRGDDKRSGDDAGVLVVEYQWQDTEQVHVVTRPDTGETVELDEEQWKEQKSFIEESGVQHATKRQTTIRRAFFVGDTAAQTDVVTKKHWSYNFITGKRDRRTGMWFGIVRSLINPQQWANKWMSQMLHIINSNSKGGVMAERSAVEAHEFEAKWADPSGVVLVNDGALKDGRIQPKPSPTWPAGVDKLLEYATVSFSAVSGVNQEILGLADREQPGVLEYQRKQSAVTLLAPLFDSLKRYRKEDGRCWLAMMQQYMADGRLIRITSEQPQTMGMPLGPGQASQDVPLQQGENYLPFWRDEAVAEYDVIVDTSASAPNQKEATWAVLTTLYPAIKDFIDPQTMLLFLEYSPMPESLVAKLKAMQEQKAAQPPQPPPEMQKAMAQIEAQKAISQADMQLQQAKAQAEIQLAQQKAQADIQLEREKIAAKAEADRAKSITDAQVKMHATEIQAFGDRQGQAMQLEADTAASDADRAQVDARRQQEQAVQAERDQATERMERNQQMLAEMMQQVMGGIAHMAKVAGAPVRLKKGANGEKIAERIMQ